MKHIQVLSSTVWRTLCELWWSLPPTLLWTKRILVSPQRWGEWGRIAKGSCQEVFSWPIVFSRRRKRVCVLPVLLSQVAWTLVMITYFLFLSFFFVQDSSRWLKCCPVYIYSMWSSHSSAWSQCEWSVWHWYRTADETLLIGYSTLNKDVSSLISIFFFFFMYHQRYIWTTVSPVRWVVGWFECTGCLVSKGKAFVLHLLQETNYEVFWMSSWRRRLEDDQLWEWRSVQHWGGPRGLWSISASAMTFRNPDIPWQDRSNKK